MGIKVNNVFAPKNTRHTLELNSVITHLNKVLWSNIFYWQQTKTPALCPYDYFARDFLYQGQVGTSYSIDYSIKIFQQRLSEKDLPS